MFFTKQIGFFILISLFVSANFCVAKDYQGADLAKILEGKWKNEDGSADFFEFLPNKVIAYDGKYFIFYRALYGKNKIGLFNPMGKGYLEVKIINSTRFSVTNEDKKEIFYITNKDPDHKAESEKFILGKDVPNQIDIKNIQKSLESCVLKNKEERFNTEQGEIARIDDANTKFLTETIRKFGWIYIERFGAAAASKAFLIVKYSGNLQLKLCVLEEIKKEIEQKKGDPIEFAVLYDETKLEFGEKQKYGSYVTSTLNQEVVETLVHALEEKENVELRRKEIGLIALKQYLENYNKETPTQKIIFQVDVIPTEIKKDDLWK